MGSTDSSSKLIPSAELSLDVIGLLTFDIPIVSPHSFLYIPIYSYIVHGLRHGLHLVALDQVLSSARDENGDGQDRFDIASFNACLGAMAWPQAMAWLQKVGNWGIGENMLEQMILCVVSI